MNISSRVYLLAKQVHIILNRPLTRSTWLHPNLSILRTKKSNNNSQGISHRVSLLESELNHDRVRSCGFIWMWCLWWDGNSRSSCGLCSSQSTWKNASVLRTRQGPIPWGQPCQRIFGWWDQEERAHWVREDRQRQGSLFGGEWLLAK